jgi:hypothetical protein
MRFALQNSSYVACWHIASFRCDAELVAIGAIADIEQARQRISTQTLMDILEVPQRQRTAGNYRHLATLMAELGWTAVRVRDFTRGGYREQVRGYVRDARPVH